MSNYEWNVATVKKDFFWIFSLFLFFAVSLNYEWRTGYVVWYGCLLLVAITYLYAFRWQLLLHNLSFFIWFACFFGLGVVSLSWSLSVSAAMDVIKGQIVCVAVLFLIHSSIGLGTSIDTILKCYFVATLVNAVYVIFAIDLAQLGETQLGGTLMDGWNGNGIGFMMANGVLIGYYLFEKCKNKPLKIFYLVAILGLTVLTLYTGSRTAFIMLVAELVLYFWMRHPEKIAKNIAITVLVIVIGLYLVMNVESFYNVLGVRLEGLFALFSGEGDVDSSANIRNIFMENGKEWFSEQPLLGHGINNYKVLNREATGRYTYAHNNFIEIAVDFGIVGLVLYYAAYAYLIFRLFQLLKTDSLNVLLLSALIASLLSQYGTVSYYDFYQNFLLLLGFLVVSRSKNEITEDLS